MPALSLGLLFSAASVLVLLVGLYYSYLLSRKTSKATVLWSLLLLFTVTLSLNSVAEVLELWDSGAGLEEGAGGMEELGESLEHNTLVASSAILLCISLVLRRSLLVPV